MLYIYIYIYDVICIYASLVYDPSFSAKPISYALRYGSRNLNAALYALLYITYLFMAEYNMLYVARGTDYRNFMSAILHTLFYTHSQFIKRFEFML